LKVDEFVNELDKEYTEWENGNDKGYTLKEIEESITLLKGKRHDA